MVSSGNTRNHLLRGKVDPCGVCNLRVKANSVLSVQCDNWINCRCARVKMVIAKFSRNFTCNKCEGDIGESVELEERLCDEMETVMKFSYLDDRMIAV